MGTHLSALTSCASRRSNSINRNRWPNFRKEHPDGNPSWANRSTTSTTTTRSTSSLLSRHYHSQASVDAIGHCTDTNVKSSQQQHHRSIEYDEKVGREKRSSTNASASASLERDLSGEGFQEEVDSILDSINFTLTDSLRTLYGPTTDVILETEIMTTETMTTMKKRRTVIQNSQESKLRRLSGGSCFGGVKTRSEKLWDSSCDDVIKDIFHQIYAQKIVVSTPTHPSHVAHWPHMAECWISIVKFVPLSLLFNAISKRIELERWEWSQIEGNLS